MLSPDVGPTVYRALDFSLRWAAIRRDQYRQSFPRERQTKFFLLLFIYYFFAFNESTYFYFGIDVSTNKFHLLKQQILWIDKRLRVHYDVHTHIYIHVIICQIKVF